MTARKFHIGASFAIVLVAYWAYALFALPWIEPAAVMRTVIVTPPPPITDDLDLALLFPKDAWELHDAKIISSGDQVLLLWKTYANHPNGWVDLDPLTIIFLGEENDTDPKERMRHAVVMEVPSGANLHFDRPLDLNHGGMGMGRLIEGRLRGQVKIRSQGKRPDHQDDLLVLTHDVELTEQRITTPNDVEFWYGPNTGRGRQMEMKLLPRLGPHVANQDGPNIGGIEQFQLEHVERLHLDLGPPPAMAGQALEPRLQAAIPAKAGTPAPAAAPAGPLMPGSLSSRSGPVEITCRGPFRFHLVEEVATFRDQVEVLRIHPDGPSDHMYCDLLSVFFTRPVHPAVAAKGKPSAPGFDLQPSRIEAQGRPVTLLSPIDHVRAQAEKLQYNLSDGHVYMEDSREVTLQKERDEIHTPSLSYTPGPPNHTNMFQLVAAGPGWLRGEMAGAPGSKASTPGAGAPGQQLEARWRTKLEVRPQDQFEVISLTGGAELNFQAMGQLAAQEIHFWLHEAPPRGPAAQAAGQSSLQPDRLLALGNVVGNSPQFSNRDDRMEVWFTNDPAGSALPGNASAGGMMNPIAGQTQYSVLGTQSPVGIPGQPYVPSTAVLGGPGPAGTSPLAAQDPATAGTPGRQHLDIAGRLLQARVTLHDQQHSELTEVTVVDDVRLQETQTAQPGDMPLLVTGQWMHVTDANTPQAKVTVIGKPAHMEGRGMSLTGPNIAIDRGANTLKMDGAGHMEKILDRDLENHPLEHPGNMRIDWLTGMNFDGLKAHFQDNVKVTSETQVLQSSWLDVSFQHRVSFSDANAGAPSTLGPGSGVPGQPPLVEKLLCGGGVYIVNRTFDAGQPVAFDRIRLKDFELNNITGNFRGSGPGRVISVRRGGNQDLGIPAGPMGGAGPVAGQARGRPQFQPTAFGAGRPQQADPNELTGVDLAFYTSITGNKPGKHVEFHGRVRAATSVVTSWTATLDDDDPNHLGPKALVLHSDDLELADMGPIGDGSGENVEARALGNVNAEGTNYYARCARMSISQAKDQPLVFEGDGRSDAELYKQDTPGGTTTPIKAQKITYFRKTGVVDVDGFRSFERIEPPSKPPPGRK